MIKEFLPFNVVRNDALKLAHKMYTDGFIPDVIYCSLRGGRNRVCERACGYGKVLHYGRGI